MTASIDASRRFVLPADSPYPKNLAALWTAEPKLAEAIEATEAQPSHPVELARSGLPTVISTTGDGRKIHLHSRYDPAGDATRLIDSCANIDECVMFTVAGFGLGYHVQELLDRTGDDALLCIIEHDLLMLRTAMEQRDLTKLIESGRALWFWRQDKADLFTRLTPYQPSVSMGLTRVEHAPSIQVAPEFHGQMQTWIEEFQAYAKTSVSTLVLNGKRTAENVTANLPWYIATPCLSRLKDACRGQPAVIVSAGPSLRKNKHLLKDVRGKAVLIAVQTTLQPMLELGVEPDFVTSLDYHDICTRFFERLPSTLRTELVAEPKATSAIFDMNPGPLSILGNDFAESLVAEMKLNRTKLRSGATVAHLAYYLAEHLGCDPIIFIGQDLGFSDGLCYAPGTGYDDVWRPELNRFCTVEMKQWEQIVRDRNILRKVDDHQGRPMYTEERLFTYLQHFERDFAQSTAKLIDATEGGVLKRGTTPMTFADAIARYCIKPHANRLPEHPGMRWDLLDNCADSLARRQDEAREIANISRQTLPLLEEIRDHLEDQGRVNRAIAKVDMLRARLEPLGPCYALIMQLTQKTELQRFHADRKISASKVDGVERQRRQISRDIDNVKAVLDATGEFMHLMQTATANLEAFRARKHDQHRRAA
jgi:hypothetical protein